MNATQAADAAPAVRRRRRSYFYVGITVLMLVIVLAGFWPPYYGRLVAGAGLEARQSHLLIHVHSTLFLGWLLVLLGQAWLARTGHIAAHRRAGPMLAAYGFGAAVFGTYAGLVLAARRLEFGRTLDQAAAFTFSTTTDMLAFAGFLAAAVAWRRRPEAHKRLILLATWSLAIVGYGRLLGRMPWIVDNSAWLRPILLPLPIWLGIAYDWHTRRRVHPVWWIGLAFFLVWSQRRLLAESEAWLPIGRRLLQPFL